MTAAPASGIVSYWFGSRFAGLHPLLQALHRHGRTLPDEVGIRMGRGMAGIAMPAWLLPRSNAYKYIDDGQYRFHAEFSSPLLGRLLSSGGLLQATLHTPDPEPGE